MFYVIGTASIIVFCYGFYRHIAKYARGQSLSTPTDFGKHIARMFSDVLSQRTVKRRDHSAGWAHTGIFYGYLFGAMATTLYFIEIDILKPLFGITFVKGDFYLVMSLLLDLGHLALICGLIYMMVRRATFHLPKLNYLRAYRKETELSPVAQSWTREDRNMM